MTDRLSRYLATRPSARAAWAAAPDRVVMILVAVALAAATCVSLGIHYWFTVAPLAALVAAGLWRITRPRTGASTSSAVAGIAAIAIAAVWAAVNALWAAEYLLVVRDPGFLTLSGLWLVDHPSTDIPSLGAVEAAATQTNLIADAAQAWNLSGDVIQPQGAKMLPAVLAVGGWLGGDTGVLIAAPVIAAVALLAVYAVAARVLRPGLALTAMGAMGLTIAHIGLGRAAYSEPLTLVLVWSAIALAMDGVRRQDRWAWAASAVISGSTLFARVDGAAFALGIAAGAIIAIAMSGSPARWRATWVVAYGLVQAGTVAAGYASLHHWSTAYLARLWDEAVLLISAYAGGLAFTAIAALVWIWASRRSGGRARLSPRVSLGVGGLSLAVLVGLASRPLWMIARRGTDTARHQFTNDVVGSFQRAAGFDIDPTRTYAESTVTWLSFYLTWPLVVAAMLGIAVLTYRMARGSWRLAVPIVGLAVPSLLYLVRPSIVPDQIWAIRRLEPATVPLFVLGAVVFLWALAALVRRPAWRITMWGSLAMLVLIISTWVTISPGSVRPVEGSSVIGITELDGARAQLDELCAIEPGRPIVLVGQSAHFGSLRVMCDVPVVLALQDPSRQSLVEMTEVWGTAPLVLTTRADAVEWTAPPQIVVDSIVKQTEFALQSLPTVYYSRSYQWFAGIPGADGVVVPEELPAAAVEVSEP